MLNVLQRSMDGYPYNISSNEGNFVDGPQKLPSMKL